MNNRGEVAAAIESSTDWWDHAVVLSTGTPRPLANGPSEALALNDSGLAITRLGPFQGAPGACLILRPTPDPIVHSVIVASLPFAAAAINNSLEVVGEGSIWREGATASVSSLVEDLNWRISNAIAVNNRGQIAAYGVNSVTGQHGAVRLDPVPNSSGSRAARRR